jgi:outer membrane protease
MEDRDWQDSRDSRLTNYSQHTNTTKGAFFFDADTGVSVPVSLSSLQALFGVFFRFSYMNLSWSAQDGFLQYATENPLYSGYYDPWDPSLEKINYYGPAIDYTQTWQIFSPGLRVGLSFRNIFFADIACTVTPFIIKAAAEDLHHNPKKSWQFKDYPEGGLCFEPSLALGFRHHKNFGLELYASYRQISGSKGDTYSRLYGSGSTLTGIYTQDGKGGAGYWGVDSGIAVKITL